jgi:hypothetical protein
MPSALLCFFSSLCVALAPQSAGPAASGSQSRARNASAGTRRRGSSVPPTAAGSSGGSSKGAGPGAEQSETNPFAFNALSKMLACQEAWRRNPCPASVDMAALSAPGNAGTLTLLLSIEDEFDRCISTHFTQIHPVPETCARLVGLYRNPRFSDHLLARWLLERGSKGPLRKLIPKQ